MLIKFNLYTSINPNFKSIVIFKFPEVIRKRKAYSYIFKSSIRKQIMTKMKKLNATLSHHCSINNVFVIVISAFIVEVIHI